jgi:hypothetical protein
MFTPNPEGEPAEITTQVQSRGGCRRLSFSLHFSRVLDITVLERQLDALNCARVYGLLV